MELDYSLFSSKPTGSENIELTHENATHLLQCEHVIGRNRRVYYMRCHVLKTMPDGRLKLQAYGDRYWKGKEHLKKTRYVQPWRVRPIAQEA